MSRLTKSAKDRRLTVLVLLMMTAMLAPSADALPPRAGEETFPDPNIPSGETLIYRHTHEDRNPKRYLADIRDAMLVTNESVRIVREERDGAQYYVVAQKNTLFGGTSMEHTTLIKRGPQLAVEEDRYSQFTADGRVLDQRTFNVARYFTRHPPDTVLFQHIDIFLRAIDFEEKKHTFNLAADKGFVLRVFLKVTDVEDVDTPAGVIKAYRTELMPDFASIFTSKILASIFSKFFKPFKMWFAVDSPHYLVKAHGTPGMPGTPKVTIELMRRTINPPVVADASAPAEGATD